MMRRAYDLAAALVLLMATALLAGCLGAPRPDGPGGEVDREAPLPRAEVREYEGRDLSSIDDFRENSTAGPQEVDREAYRLSIAGPVGAPLELAYHEVLDESAGSTTAER